MNLVPLKNLINRSHESDKQDTRYHLGCSEVGHHCERYVWLKFRWALDESKNFTPSKNHRSWGQKLRLFRRGHNEEAVVVEDLERVGCVVTRQQERVHVEGHLQGHIDGVIFNLPDVAGEGLLEIKTHSLKSFNELERHGVEKSKPQHVAQMQLYMKELGFKWALYAAVCKDDDRYWFELIELDELAAKRHRDRGVRISLSERAPEPIGGPDWWQCKICPARGMCHEERPTQEVNCRTCAHVTPVSSGEWVCGRTMEKALNEHQEAGCVGHVFNPDLIPWTMHPIGENFHVKLRNGSDSVINGEPSEVKGALTSVEVLERWER